MFSTPRMLLRPIAVDDLEHLLELDSAPAVLRLWVFITRLR